MSGAKAAFLDRLNQLKLSFLHHCVQRGQEIEAAYGGALSATEAGLRAEALQQLRDRVHKLAGAAGTHGFMPLSESARAVELRCDALLANGAALSFDDRESVRNLLLSLRRCVVDDPRLTISKMTQWVLMTHSYFSSKRGMDHI